MPNDRQKLLEYYIEYGTVIGNKLDQKAFLEDLKKEELETYQKIPLYDQPKNYVQVLANPKDKHSFITVEDVKNLPVTVDNSKSSDPVEPDQDDDLQQPLHSELVRSEDLTNKRLRLLDIDGISSRS